jgi:hypothetical protein
MKMIINNRGHAEDLSETNVQETSGIVQVSVGAVGAQDGGEVRREKEGLSLSCAVDSLISQSALLRRLRRYPEGERYALGDDETQRLSV